MTTEPKIRIALPPNENAEAFEPAPSRPINYEHRLYCNEGRQRLEIMFRAMKRDLERAEVLP